MAGISHSKEVGRNSFQLLFIFDPGGLQFTKALVKWRKAPIQGAEVCSVLSYALNSFSIFPTQRTECWLGDQKGQSHPLRTKLGTGLMKER